MPVFEVALYCGWLIVQVYVHLRDAVVADMFQGVFEQRFPGNTRHGLGYSLAFCVKSGAASCCEEKRFHGRCAFMIILPRRIS